MRFQCSPTLLTYRAIGFQRWSKERANFASPINLLQASHNHTNSSISAYGNTPDGVKSDLRLSTRSNNDVPEIETEQHATRTGRSVR